MIRGAVLNIATPEGVTFSLPLAGPVSRCLAVFVDILAISMIFQVLAPLLGLMNLTFGDIGGAVAILIQFILNETYFMVSELLWRGQTIGKKVLGLRVMDERGLKLRPAQVIVRNLVRIVDMLPVMYFAGGACCFLSKRCQRLGDLAAGTVVIRSIKLKQPDVGGVLGGKYNSFRDHPHLEARLRQKVSADEAQLALAALVRRGELEDVAAAELFERLAAQFRGKVKFPDEVEFGLSGEQYVRNVVDSLYRKGAPGAVPKPVH